MKVSLVQQDIIWAQPRANRDRLDSILRPGADLYVLPEMFSTGFATSPEGIAETEPCESLEWMKAKAAEFDAAFAGSVAVRDGERYYNRFYFVQPDGSVTAYDKRHLFTYSGEHMKYTAGKERVVVEFRGVRFLLAICYDLRFPCALRSREDYDAIIVVASWPTSRRKAWDTLLKARAIENQCFVLGVDRTGDDPSCSYSGGTFLVDPYGEIIASADMADPAAEQVVSGDLDLSLLASFRQSFPVLRDRDR